MANNTHALYTPYEKNLDRSTPHSYYPRPQLKRDSYICLNGEWDFGISAEGERYGEKILVPFPPESRLSGIERRHKKGERLYYKRSFNIDNIPEKSRLFLHFGAVDCICKVYLNGTYVGENKGGYIPFSFEITSYIKTGENELRLEVTDDLDKRYPYGKQTERRGGMWYTEVSGIWQTVWLEWTPKSFIKELIITPTLTSVAIKVIGGEMQKRITLKDSGEVFEFFGEELVIEPKTVRNWFPEDPYLYEFTLECGEDKIESYFALRTVEIAMAGHRQRILLNGAPYLFNGLLDQGYFPDGIFTPATVEGYEEDIRLAKRLGFNMLRKHIKIEPMIFYYLCDKLGIAVFQDMVNNSDYSFIRDTALPTIGFQKLPDRNMHRDKRSREIFIKTMLETQRLLYNTPSVVYYTIFNEGWGQFASDEVYEMLKSVENTRIIDSTSGWFRQKKSDVLSLHIYFKRLRVKEADERPWVISEFGGYSYREKGHLFSEKNYGYRTFATGEELEDGIIRLYNEEVKPLIRDGVCALVYTQLSDVEDETNGLITYDRQKVKVNEEKIRICMENLLVDPL